MSAFLLGGMLFCATLHGGEMERLKELTREIQILNLLNGFELTEEQTEMLKKKVRRVENLQSEFEQYLEMNGEIFEVGLEKSVEILAQGKELPPSLKKDIALNNEKVRELHREMEEEILEIAKGVEDMLAPQQVQQLKDYVPCLIPPPGKMRIGQSGGSEGLVAHLDKIRDLPENRYQDQKERIVERVVEKRKKHSSLLAEFDEEGERVRIGELLDRIRKMSDVEFALNKEAIVEEFKGEHRDQENENSVTLKIRSFLLDPIILNHL